MSQDDREAKRDRSDISWKDRALTPARRPVAANTHTVIREENAGYVVDHRIRQLGDLSHNVVDLVVDLDSYIAWRAEGHADPLVLAALRELQAIAAGGAMRLIGQYVTGQVQ